MTASVHVDSPTEGRNPATVGIDRLPTADVVRLVVSEEAAVPAAVAADPQCALRPRVSLRAGDAGCEADPG